MSVREELARLREESMAIGTTLELLRQQLGIPPGSASDNDARTRPLWDLVYENHRQYDQLLEQDPDLLSDDDIEAVVEALVAYQGGSRWLRNLNRRRAGEWGGDSGSKLAELAQQETAAIKARGQEIRRLRRILKLRRAGHSDA